MIRLKTGKTITPTDISVDKIAILNKDYGFSIVLWENFTPGTHCKGFPDSSECNSRTCYGASGALAHGIINETPCKTFEAVDKEF